MTKPRAARHRWRFVLAIAGAVVTLWLYLFVSAPPQLASTSASGATLPIGDVLAMLERENDAARALWTEEIVQRGASVGLTFDERWRDDDVHAGPLPALFLRETARNLERTPLGLSLFLGSPYPVSSANKLTGMQEVHFAQLVATGAPQTFFEASTARWTAMFSDVAVSDACVTCHNEHADSPKRDWQRGEVMGATTWMYPDAHVSVERTVELVAALRASIRLAYRAYLEKVATFPRVPTIGMRWPCEGFSLPTEEVFMAELARRTSQATLLALLEPGRGFGDAASAAPLACARPAPANTLVAASLLVVRSERSVRVTVEQDGRRHLLARLPPDGVTAVSTSGPVRLGLSAGDGVTVEYRGQPVAVPSASAEIEVVLEAPDPGKS
ncbi:MAG: DUF3365 domain-containing protein [Kofleriaceae bacterium]|nr:DUF3365 domain-containing protein [Kofleriaceae bacterium]